jgi:lysophospholipase L1-like esterase
MSLLLANRALSISVSVDTPILLPLTVVNNTSIKLDWTSSEKVEIYRSTSELSGYSLIITIDEGIATYSDTGLTAYNFYFYKIRAVRGVIYSDYTSPLNISTSIFYDTFARPTLGAPYVVTNGANYSMEGSYLVARAESAAFVDSLQIQYGIWTMNESWEQQIEIGIGGVIGDDDNGIGIGLTSQPHLAVWNKTGKIAIYNGSTLVYESVDILTPEINTHYNILFKAERWSFYVKVTNLSDDTYIEYNYEVSMSDTNWYKTSTPVFYCFNYSNSLGVYLWNHRDLNTLPKKALFVGDSIAYGAQVSTRNLRFPNLIFGENTNDYAVYGGPGDSSYNLADRLTELYKLRPKYTVILIGSNDSVATTTESNLSDILDGLIANSIIPIVLAVLPRNDANKSSWLSVLAALCVTKSVKYIDTYSLMTDEISPTHLSSFFNSGDGIHPNDAGDLVIAQAIESNVDLTNITNPTKTPTILTLPTEVNLVGSGATVGYTLDIQSLETTYSIQYGLTNALGSTQSGGTTNSNGAVTVDLNGLTREVPVYWKMKCVNSTSTTYSKMQTFTLLPHLLLTSDGTGAGVMTFEAQTSSNCLVTLGANAKFYSDSAGTLDESSTWLILASSGSTYRTRYVKCTTGTASVEFADISLVKKLRFISSPTNAPILSGDVSKFVNIDIILITAKNTLSGDITNLTLLTSLIVTGTNNITGSITLLTLLTTLTVTGNNTISGSITTLTSLTSITVTGNNTLTGSVSALTGLTVLTLGGAGINTVGGDLGGSGTSAIVNGITTLSLNPCAMDTYTSGATWSNVAANIRPSVGYGYSSDEVDGILIDMANSAGGPSGKIIYLLGSCASRTSASDAAVATLIGRGCTINTN